MTDMREKARELTRTTYDLASFEVASNEIESALREARNAALEEALEIAEECARKEPGYPKTGSAALARAMMRIRALKDKE